MKKTLLVFTMVISCILLFAQQKNVRIYINPGHGGWDADDRYMPLPPFGQLPRDLDTLAFFESSSNLDKGLCLYQLLDSVGGFDLKISRTQNRTEDDLNLYSIVQMNNEFGSDFFLSIHSNAGDGLVNYPLQLHSGVDPNDDPNNYSDVIPLAQSDRSREICNVIGRNIKSCKISSWTNELQVRGDKTFARDIMGWSNGYGVLRWLRTPGEISEGRMHDYVPETYRMMNHDFRWLEAWHFMKSFVNFLQGKKLQDGNIAGDIRDGILTSDDLPKYRYHKGRRDGKLPINGADVYLVQGKDTIDHYLTDQFQNGFYIFKNVKPGDYKVVISKDAYYTIEQEVTAVADTTIWWLADMNLKRTTPPEVIGFTPANNVKDSILCSTPIVMDFNWDMDRAKTEAAFSIEPAIEGTFTWEKKGRQLVFTPNVPFTGKTVYTVTLNTTACHADTNYVNTLQKPYVSKFVTDSHDRLNLLASSPKAGEELGALKPSFYILMDGALTSSVCNSSIVIKDKDGNEVEKMIRSLAYNKVDKPYGSLKFDIVKNLNEGEDYKLVIGAESSDNDQITAREDIVIPFSVKAITEPDLVKAVDCATKVFNYNKGLSTGVKKASTGISSTYKAFKKSNKFTYEFEKGAENANVEYTLSNPAEVTNDMNLVFAMKGDFSHNSIQFKLVNDDKSDSIYVDAAVLDGYNWKLYEVEMIDVPTTGKWTLNAIVVNQTKNAASTLPGEFYIENIYRRYASETDVEQVIGNNVSLWPNPSTDFVYIEAPESAIVELYTVDGKKIFSQAAVNAASEAISIRHIDTYNLDNGIYIISIKTADDIQSLKFVKE